MKATTRGRTTVVPQTQQEIDRINAAIHTPEFAVRRCGVIHPATGRDATQRMQARLSTPPWGDRCEVVTRDVGPWHPVVEGER